MPIRKRRPKLRAILPILALSFAVSGAHADPTHYFGNSLLVQRSNGVGKMMYRADHTFVLLTSAGDTASGTWSVTDGKLCLNPEKAKMPPFCVPDDPVHRVGNTWKATSPDGLPEELTLVAGQRLSPTESAQKALSELETRRCAAISSVNVKQLDEVLADDYVHVHAIGLVNNKAEFIAGIQQRPRGVERGPLSIRVYGNAAIITGEQRNIAPPPAQAGLSPPAAASAPAGMPPVGGKYFATQVAFKEQGQWRFVSMHVTAHSDKAAPESRPNQP